MRGRTASRAQCIGEPVTELLSVNQTSFQVCLPAMAAPNQLLRFEARLVLDSGSSPLLHTQAASLYSLPEIGGSGVFKEEIFGNLNWSMVKLSRQFLQKFRICNPCWKLLNRVGINALLCPTVRLKPF